jgi:hypothetical protein
VRLLRAGGLEVFQGGPFRAVLDLENPLPSDHPRVQRFSATACLHSASYRGCDGLLAGLPRCYDRGSGARGGPPTIGRPGKKHDNRSHESGSAVAGRIWRQAARDAVPSQSRILFARIHRRRGLSRDPKALLFQTYSRASGQLTAIPLPQAPGQRLCDDPEARAGRRHHDQDRQPYVSGDWRHRLSRQRRVA